MTDATIPLLTRIAEALERLAPPPVQDADLDAFPAYVWRGEDRAFTPVESVSRVDIALLAGVDRQRDALLENTRRFARGLPANNALLWGARGMGKSSLVKAVQAAVAVEGGDLALIEIHREDIDGLAYLLRRVRGRRRRYLVFCDDLSFDVGEQGYKSLKAALDGGVEGRPANVLFYATSNRRHLISRQMIENEERTALMPGDTLEEKVSLSDRFGLWLGFHACDQATYLAMIAGYVRAYDLPIGDEELARRAKEWAVARGSRSGRVAWQFIQDLAGDLGRTTS